MNNSVRRRFSRSVVRVAGVGSCLVALAGAQCGTQWSSVAAPSSLVSALTSWDPDGSGPLPRQLVAGGRFQAVGALAASQVALLDPATGAWSALGSGVVDPFTWVQSLAVLPGGELVAGCWYDVQRYDGSAWGSIGNADEEVAALLTLANGDLLAGGRFSSIGGAPAMHVARWDGTAWSQVGTGLQGNVQALVQLPGGDVIAGGLQVSRWNGSAWQLLGGPTQVFALAVLRDGSVVAAGDTIARWNGAGWASLGALVGGEVRALQVLPDGDLLATGRFVGIGGIAADRIARWDGISWSPVGSGLASVGFAMTDVPAGDVFIAGGLPTSGGGSVDRLSSTCPALVQSAGAGCSSASLAAALPWTGSDWSAEADGLPAAALVFAVTGLAPASLPLGAVFATALPGCTLQVAPDLVTLVLANQGRAAVSLSLPNLPALAGVVFHEQMVVLELAGALAVTATEALRMTVGVF